MYVEKIGLEKNSHICDPLRDLVWYRTAQSSYIQRLLFIFFLADSDVI